MIYLSPGLRPITGLKSIALHACEGSRPTLCCGTYNDISYGVRVLRASEGVENKSLKPILCCYFIIIIMPLFILSICSNNTKIRDRIKGLKTNEKKKEKWQDGYCVRDGRGTKGPSAAEQCQWIYNDVLRRYDSLFGTIIRTYLWYSN